jgi:5'-nucleotidase
MKKLTIATSSAALFDLEQSDRVYKEEGLEAYSKYQLAREHEPLAPGRAFFLIKKLLNLNSLLENPDRVEVILLSRNTSDTGLRVFKSIEHHNLSISRAAFSGGTKPHRYMAAFGVDLFLSTERADVVEALEDGKAAASILSSSLPSSKRGDIRFAFDGDAVLFSDEAEEEYQKNGLEDFLSTEKNLANVPLRGGPFRSFVESLNQLKSEFIGDTNPIRTALVTARSSPAHERVVKTLRSWGMSVDESLFLGGMEKAAFLNSYGADIFFDDQAEHCRIASEKVLAGHVPSGVKNRT